MKRWKAMIDITDLSARAAEIDRRGNEYLDCGSDPEHVANFRIEKKLSLIHISEPTRPY